MNRYEAILAGVIGVCLIVAMMFYGYQGNQCKVAAIKAGIAGEAVFQTCK